MKVVLQRVTQASVTINNKINGEIKTGLLVLLGIENADTLDDIIWLSAKICSMRIFNDANNLMNLSIADINGELLLISQFTLYASTKKGNRPSFIKAARPEVAISLYDKFIAQLQNDLGKNIATGIFGADMQVALINDGPVTIIIDSKAKE
jgi:D-aminoacyl-tRNA deacylase